MPLDASGAVEQAEILLEYHQAEREQLDTLRRYWKGRQALPAVIPSTAPVEVKRMAQIARVNVCKIVVDTLAQSLFVDGFRGKGESDDAEVWATWQANRMDARQSGIHRGTFGYGASYAVVLPGDPQPVIRGVSPRSMTAVYGEDQDWPMWALERMGYGAWRLYDDEAVYFLSSEPRNQFSGDKKAQFEVITSELHGLGVTPVVRYLDEDDLDAYDEPAPAPGVEAAPTFGQIAPLMQLQDQIDLTTFGLLVAQHYSAFRQRYILGWTAPSEAEKLKASASTLWTLGGDHEDEDGDEEPKITVGEFSETNLDGYIKSREASLKYAATLSQTPVHELIGELVNLSAEALAAAEAGRDRKVEERKALLGEAHEQTMWLAGQAQEPVVAVPDDAQVVWRDTSARAFAATVDGLGKLVTMLGIPPQELWERVPGATNQDVERWKAAAQQGDSFAFLNDLLERQAGGGNKEPVFG